MASCESTGDVRLESGLGQSVAPLRAAANAIPRMARDYRSFGEFDALCPAPVESWLSVREQAELSAWRDQRRRRAWLLGRAVAKRLVRGLIASAGESAPLIAQIEILSRDAAGRISRPIVWVDGREQPWSLSISHSRRGALAAIAAGDCVSLGADLADCETFSPGFVELWFTPAEQQWYRDVYSPGIAGFIWAAKEALYKACNTGESFAPREFEIRSDGQASYRGRALVGCWLQSFTVDSQLAVVASVAREGALTNLSSLATCR